PPLVASGVPPDGEGDILSSGRKACTFLRVAGFSAITVSNHFVRRAGCPALRQAGGPPPRGRCRGRVTQTKVGRARRTARAGSDSDSLELVAFFLRSRLSRLHVLSPFG